MLLTSFSQKGFAEYGHRLMKGLTVFMPAMPVMVYSEDDLQGVPGQPIMASLNSVRPFWEFIERHGGNAVVNGRGSPTWGWKEKDRRDGYCFKFDAVKFCRKVFAIADAARRVGHGALTWIDADAYPFKQVPMDLFDNLVGAHDVAYLGRDGTHSECGFIHFRLPEAMPLIQAWENFYASDRFLQEREWHDSYLFDIARREVPSVRCRNVSRQGARGHVWVTSPLGLFWDHMKGERKTMGYSPERISRGIG